MSDDDIRALFHRVDAGPPLGIDPRDIMARGRRVRTRRTGIAIGGSVLGVAVAAVAIGLSLGGDPRSPDLDRPAEKPTTSTTSPTSSTTAAPVPPGLGSETPPSNNLPNPGNGNAPPYQGNDPQPGSGVKPPAGNG